VFVAPGPGTSGIASVEGPDCTKSSIQPSGQACMKCSYRFVSENYLLAAVFTGTLMVSDISDCLREAVAEQGVPGDVNILVDARKVGIFNASPAQTEVLEELINHPDRATSHSKIAFVSRNVEVIRFAAVLGEKIGRPAVRIGSFETVEEALDWLGVDPGADGTVVPFPAAN
jgi:hypothetical protein